MARSNPHARKLLAGVVAPLVEAHGGVSAVSEAVGRDRSSVHRWTKGDIGWDGLALLASSLRVDVIVTFPAHGHATGTTKEPPPDWAREMEQRLTKILLANRKAFLATMATHFAALGVGVALDDPPQSEPSPETREASPGQAGPK